MAKPGKGLPRACDRRNGRQTFRAPTSPQISIDGWGNLYAVTVFAAAIWMAAFAFVGGCARDGSVDDWPHRELTPPPQNQNCRSLKKRKLVAEYVDSTSTKHARVNANALTPPARFCFSETGREAFQGRCVHSAPAGEVQHEDLLNRATKNRFMKTRGAIHATAIAPCFCFEASRSRTREGEPYWITALFPVAGSVLDPAAFKSWVETPRLATALADGTASPSQSLSQHHAVASSKRPHGQCKTFFNEAHTRGTPFVWALRRSETCEQGRASFYPISERKIS